MSNYIIFKNHIPTHTIKADFYDEEGSNNYVLFFDAHDNLICSINNNSIDVIVDEKHLDKIEVFNIDGYLDKTIKELENEIDNKISKKVNKSCKCETKKDIIDEWLNNMALNM